MMKLVLAAMLIAGASASSCTTCATTNLACPAGKGFKDAAAILLACPAGTADAQLVASTACEPCPNAASTLTNGGCTQCADANTLTCTSATIALTCAAGTYLDSTNSAAPTCEACSLSSIACTAGEGYGLLTATATALQVLCPATDADAGTTQRTAQLDAASACTLTCPNSGSILVNGSCTACPDDTGTLTCDATHSLTCGDGFFLDESNTSAHVCTECGAGAATCTAADAHVTCDATFSLEGTTCTACVMPAASVCGAGKEVTTDTLACPAGNSDAFATATTATVGGGCIACPAGKHAAASDAIGCTDCDATGLACDAGTGFPVPTGAGTVADPTVTALEHMCPAGTAAALVKATACTRTCPNLDSSAVNGDCTACHDANASACTDATAGTATACNDGHYLLAGACIACETNCATCDHDGCLTNAVGYAVVAATCIAAAPTPTPTPGPESGDDAGAASASVGAAAVLLAAVAARFQ